MIMVRVVHCVIKAWSVGVREIRESGETKVLGEGLAQLSFVKRFNAALHGFKKNTLPDLWLGAIIGFAEISFYPVLIFTNNLSAIGGWLVIKTAGQWKMWQDNPIDFNRFLVTNLINLVIAYFFTVKFIQ